MNTKKIVSTILFGCYLFISVPSISFWTTPIDLPRAEPGGVELPELEKQEKEWIEKKEAWKEQIKKWEDIKKEQWEEYKKMSPEQKAKALKELENQKTTITDMQQQLQAETAPDIVKGEQKNYSNIAKYRLEQIDLSTEMLNQMLSLDVLKDPTVLEKASVKEIIVKPDVLKKENIEDIGRVEETIKKRIERSQLDFEQSTAELRAKLDPIIKGLGEAFERPTPEPKAPTEEVPKLVKSKMQELSNRIQGTFKEFAGAKIPENLPKTIQDFIDQTKGMDEVDRGKILNLIEEQRRLISEQEGKSWSEVQALKEAEQSIFRAQMPVDEAIKQMNQALDQIKPLDIQNKLTMLQTWQEMLRRYGYAPEKPNIEISEAWETLENKADSLVQENPQNQDVQKLAQELSNYKKNIKELDPNKFQESLKTILNEDQLKVLQEMNLNLENKIPQDRIQTIVDYITFNKDISDEQITILNELLKDISKKAFPEKPWYEKLYTKTTGYLDTARINAFYWAKKGAFYTLWGYYLKDITIDQLSSEYKKFPPEQQIILKDFTKAVKSYLDLSAEQQQKYQSTIVDIIEEKKEEAIKKAKWAEKIALRLKEEVKSVRILISGLRSIGFYELLEAPETMIKDIENKLELGETVAQRTQERLSRIPRTQLEDLVGKVNKVMTAEKWVKEMFDGLTPKIERVIIPQETDPFLGLRIDKGVEAINGRIAKRRATL